MALEYPSTSSTVKEVNISTSRLKQSCISYWLFIHVFKLYFNGSRILCQIYFIPENSPICCNSATSISLFLPPLDGEPLFHPFFWASCPYISRTLPRTGKREEPCERRFPLICSLTLRYLCNTSVFELNRFVSFDYLATKL